MKKNILILFIVLIPLQIFGADLESTVRDAFELYSVNNFAEAAPMFEEAYYMAKKNTPKDVSSRFRTSLYAGLSYRGMNEYQQAAAWFAVSFALAEKVNDLYDIPTLLAYIAESERMSGNAKQKYFKKL